MKIIDLLNKIANGEEVPKEVEYNGLILHYNYELNDYCCDYEDDEGELHGEYLFTSSFDKNIAKNLNDTVEILEEEKKIPEKLEDISEIKCVGCKVEINIVGNKTLFDTDTPIVTEHCIYKINQLIKNQKKIIDYLKSKGE